MSISRIATHPVLDNFAIPLGAVATGAWRGPLDFFLEQDSIPHFLIPLQNALRNVLPSRKDSSTAAPCTTFLLLATLAVAIRLMRLRRAPSLDMSRTSDCHIDTDSTHSDPGLLRKHSTFKSYSTSRYIYQSIRTFYRPHPQADKLPDKPTPLPLLVFVHGLGGSLAQFTPLLTSLVNTAPCFAIDMPGCGRSVFAPKDWEAYSHDALTELLNVAISEHCTLPGQEVVLIGHSMGCSFSASLATSTSPKSNFKIVGMVAICPKASSFTKQQISMIRKLLYVPTPIFDLWRRWDRRGGVDSESVLRFVGKGADLETRKMQVRFNEQSKTPVWRRMLWGALPTEKHGKLVGGMPDVETWSKLSLPMLLVAGANDHVTKPEELDLIVEALKNPKQQEGKENGVGSDAVPQTVAPVVEIVEEMARDSSQVKEKLTTIEKHATKALKTSIIPSPATHALLYDQATYRTLAGLIHAFLPDHIDHRLSLGWQLQHLATEGKWDVKNLEKWNRVTPVGEPIAGIFQAMKTLREVDEVHSPKVFVEKWSDKIKAVVDISHESPVYDPQKLDAGGIRYHKFPTVSKIPPTVEEVRAFVVLVDKIRAESGADGKEDNRLIGVHCHYGFNRTGFFICSYLIEREGFAVQAAFDLFREKRPPGIRHEHFIDTLWMRNCMGLERKGSVGL